MIERMYRGRAWLALVAAFTFTGVIASCASDSDSTSNPEIPPTPTVWVVPVYEVVTSDGRHLDCILFDADRTAGNSDNKRGYGHGYFDCLWPEQRNPQ